MSSFTVIPAQESFKLDSGRKGQITYSVTNTSNRPLRAEVNVVAMGTTDAAWLSLKDSKREFLASETQTVTIQVNVPSKVAAETYTLRLSAAAEADPGSDFTEGPVVSIVVPPGIVDDEDKRGFEWKWWMTVLVVVAVIIVASVALKRILDPSKTGETSAASAASAPEPDVPFAVPPLKGSTLTQAQGLASAAHLSLSTQDGLVLDPAQVGTVISQDPSPPASLPKGAAIAVTIGVQGVRVPPVMGLTQAQAETALGKAKLLPVGFNGDGSSNTPINYFSLPVGTDPALGKIVPENSNVTVIVSGRKQLDIAIFGRTKANVPEINQAQKK